MCLWNSNEPGFFSDCSSFWHFWHFLKSDIWNNVYLLCTKMKDVWSQPTSFNMLYHCGFAATHSLIKNVKPFEMHKGDERLPGSQTLDPRALWLQLNWFNEAATHWSHQLQGQASGPGVFQFAIQAPRTSDVSFLFFHFFFYFFQERRRMAAGGNYFKSRGQESRKRSLEAFTFLDAEELD